MLGIKDRVVVITGGTQGLGKAIAIEFARFGAKVVIASRDKLKGEKTLKELKELTKNCIYKKTDVTDYKQMQKLISFAVNKFGGIDFMINNAGIFIGGFITELKIGDWKKVFDVNVNGIFYGTKFAAEEMIKNGNGGRIINISSIIGVTGKLGCSAYAATKGALNAFTKNVAIDLAKYNIMVNAIIPGVCDSEINEHISNDERKRSESYIPLKRWARPEEIAKSTVFLCSNLSTYITGHLLIVDGGYLAGKEISETNSVL